MAKSKIIIKYPSGFTISHKHDALFRPVLQASGPNLKSKWIMEITYPKDNLSSQATYEWKKAYMRKAHICTSPACSCLSKTTNHCHVFGHFVPSKRISQFEFVHKFLKLCDIILHRLYSLPALQGQGGWPINIFHLLKPSQHLRGSNLIFSLDTWCRRQRLIFGQFMQRSAIHPIIQKKQLFLHIKFWMKF